MVVRKFQVRHGDSTFEVDYSSDYGFEVFQLQLFHLTSIVPDEQTIFVEDSGWPVLEDSDLISAPDELRLVTRGKFIISDEQFAQTLQKLFLPRSAGEEYRQSFDEKLQPYIRQVLMYEDERNQKKAWEMVPVEMLAKETMLTLARGGILGPSPVEQSHVFLLQLLFWFRRSFSEDVSSKIALVQRDTEPLKVLETKEGHYANYFTLYCRAFGYKSRLVMDLTGDCWTECFSQYLERWMHLHPFEALYADPFLCEKCRNKKFGNVIAIAKDGVYDVTKRYTKKCGEVLDEREMIQETVPLITLINSRKECSLVLRVLLMFAEALLRDFNLLDDTQIFSPGRQSGEEELCISRVEFGSDSFTCSSLLRDFFLPDETQKELCISRVEFGSDSCTSSSPVRMCIDEHGTRIYNEFSSVISQFIENSLSKSEVAKVLKILRGLLVDLQFQPYKKRSVSFLLDVDEGQSMGNEFLPSLGELLYALSLKSRLNICLAGNPLTTALEMPVALHAWDVLMENFNKCQNFGKDSLSFPLLTLSKLCSGYVLASGEELPSGIATAAFNGLRFSKWKEPNGGKGCWIIYKTLDNHMHELVAYNFMSADDSPMDPKDWVVEGSQDGGSSWHVLDKQTNQHFENRYEQKLYMITSKGFPSNLFRFRFQAVQNVHSTALQLSSIDLYVKKN